MYLVNVEKCLKLFDRVYVSSDSRLILREAVEAGALAIHRDKSLCGDVPNIPVYQHALLKMSQVDSVDSVVAVQANSPTIEQNLIAMAKRLMEMGVQELMTCHPDREIYGSIWALSTTRLQNYGDPYQPQPEVLIVDTSIDIHSRADYTKALQHG